MPALKVIYFFSSFCYFTIKLVCLALHAGNYVFMLLYSHGKKTVRTSRFVIFTSGLLAPKDSSSSPLSLNSYSFQKSQQNRLKGAAEIFSSELLASSHIAPQLSTASCFFLFQGYPLILGYSKLPYSSSYQKLFFFYTSHVKVSISLICY